MTIITHPGYNAGYCIPSMLHSNTLPNVIGMDRSTCTCDILCTHLSTANIVTLNVPNFHSYSSEGTQTPSKIWPVHTQ